MPHALQMRQRRVRDWLGSGPPLNSFAPATGSDRGCACRSGGCRASGPACCPCAGSAHGHCLVGGFAWCRYCQESLDNPRCVTNIWAPHPFITISSAGNVNHTKAASDTTKRCGGAAHNRAEQSSAEPSRAQQSRADKRLKRAFAKTCQHAEDRNRNERC